MNDLNAAFLPDLGKYGKAKLDTHNERDQHARQD